MSGPTSVVPPIRLAMAITGEAFTTNRKGTLRATAGEYQFQCDALEVSNLQTEVILGHPWLVENEAVLDYVRGCVHVGTQRRRTIHFDRVSRQQAPEANFETANIEVDDPAQKAVFLSVLNDFRTVFQEGGAVASNTSTKHTIRLHDDTPVRIAPYKCTPAKKLLIATQVEEMLATGVIRPSHSEYNSPIVLVKKKDGKPRFCVDYRQLNSRTRDEASPLPPIQDSLRDLGTAKVFTTLDLLSGYWQIRMSEGSKHLTAFATPDGAAYEFNVMPFGLKGAPTTFQKLMAQDVLVGYLREFAIAYLDDVIIYSKNLEEHERHLRLVMERLEQHGLRLNLSKCHFASTRLNYLGHVVTREGNTPQASHVAAIQAAAVPRTRKALRQFLGVVNWLRDYIPDASGIMAPLTDLLATSTPFRWTEQATQAFEDVKSAAARPLFLHRPDPAKPFILQTDASAIGAAAVLYQEENGQRNIINYASLRFNPTEQRYHINEQECLAVVWGIRKYRPYLEDRPFTLRTDSKTLTWLNQYRETKSKLTRWSLLLQEFSFKVEHVPGKENHLPDALSRCPGPDGTSPCLEEADRLVPAGRTPETASDPDHAYPVQEQEPLFHAMQDAQQVDPHCRRIARLLTEDNPEAAQIRQTYTARGGYIRYREGGRELIEVPRAIQPEVLRQYHDDSTAGHPGIEETRRTIATRFHWPQMRAAVADYVRSCRLCNAFKRGPLQEKAPLRPHAPAQPFEVLSVDIIGPLTPSRQGNRFGVVIMDLHSRWTEAQAVRTVTTTTVAQCLDKVFRRFGYPMALLTDNGPQFTSVAWDAALRRWQCLHWTTPIYHPRANPVERRNQELKKGLRLQLEGQNPQRWDERLGDVLFNLRTRQNAATQSSPAKALFGYELRRPGEWRDPLDEPREPRPQRTERIHANEQRYREQRYVRPDAPIPVQPRIGEFVMVRAHLPPGRPFGPRWLGPYPVVEAAGPAAVWVERPGALRAKYHVDQIRIARLREDEPAPPEPDQPAPPPNPEPQPGPSRSPQ